MVAALQNRGAMWSSSSSSADNTARQMRNVQSYVLRSCIPSRCSEKRDTDYLVGTRRLSPSDKLNLGKLLEVTLLFGGDFLFAVFL